LIKDFSERSGAASIAIVELGDAVLISSVCPLTSANPPYRNILN